MRGCFAASAFFSAEEAGALAALAADDGAGLVRMDDGHMVFSFRACRWYPIQ
jgi:hypothetical protein